MNAAAAPVSLLRRREVEARTGLSRSEIYRRINQGTFPAPIALGASSKAWPSNVIDAWIADRIAQSTTPAARAA